MLAILTRREQEDQGDAAESLPSEWLLLGVFLGDLDSPTRMFPHQLLLAGSVYEQCFQQSFLWQ